MDVALAKPPLRLLWVTPLSVHSAIGRFSHLVTEQLALRGVSVTLASCEATPPSKEQIWRTDLPVVLDPSDIIENLDVFDIVIYNIGNNFEYHGGILRFTDQRSGIFVFHDLFLHDLFYGVLQAAGRLAEHDKLVAAVYGETRQAADSQSGYGNDLQHRVENFPMTEWFAPRALACVVHGKFGVPILEAATAGRVIHLPLAFVEHMDEPPERVARGTHANCERVQVTTFGDANPNKRVASVLRAIGSSVLLREKVTYTVVGRVGDADRAYLTDLATTLGVKFEMTGRANDQEWASWMDATDVAACLRMPTTETASATVIECMAAGLPVLVTDIGFYRDLPDDLVFKVDPAREGDSLRDQLERIVGDPHLRLKAGRDAAHWARLTFSPITYAEGIEAFAREIHVEGAAVEVALRLADVSSLLGRGMDDPAVASWIKVATSLFSERRLDGQ